MTQDIAIIGGGIGGLCLAQGLREAGLDVTVYERDVTPADRLQGYRVHIDPHGARALHDCLPAHLWRAFLDTTGRGDQDFAFLTERLRLLAVIDTPKVADPADDHHSVSRIMLRQVLLSGLGDTVRFGKTYERYERLPDGRVELFFADGTSATAGIVVAADGGNSRVRAPHDLSEPTANGGIGVTEQEGALMDNTSSYVLWALGAAAGRFPSDISEMSGEQLKATVARMVSTWHPGLRTLIDRSHPDTVSLLPIRTSIPIDPWPATNITLLGDAIHSMTPMGGIGANTALRDARLLRAALTGGGDPVQAIASYEAQMREYGFAAVRGSHRLAEQFVGNSRVARAGFKTFLRVVQRLPRLKAKVFS
ncbi:2-polyprenyl-6-methoxyphenol hydroxylase [Nonomuraea solani]|uniref:2-polyprenyl-6-methoxyphenol hydroxylase n=1 Tax=Nonomuraea solani TaxID=1144553 RepID=A0A1H6EUS6_9ACTN|nr:NAD(P)/FAD-dependent oxidoreductase [Nonomuraea solani]SEH01637.1 2-polyprenyl-6-methoxyphenol hydroxylase [Nonomuraea solani]